MRPLGVAELGVRSMNTTAINRPIKHPWIWIFASFLLFGVTGAILIILKSDFSWIPRERPLEKYVWTCDPDYQTFYAPGTPQSIAVVDKVHQLWKNGYLTEEIKIPDKPILITPAFFGAPASSTDPTLIIGFNSEIAETLRRSHAK